MTVLFRCRVKKSVLTRADAVTKSLGSSTAEMFRIFVTEIARTGKVPVNLDTSENGDVMDVKRRNRVWSELDDTKNW